jgi:hypothetical protein
MVMPVWSTDLGYCSMSTRMLLVLSLLVGLAILVAFAAQLVLYS